MAGLAPDGLAVASWGALARDPSLASGFQHLVALDPPPGGTSDPLLAAAPLAHLAWGPAEAQFALAAWRAELDLRPALAATYRCLRALEPNAEPAALEAALVGEGRYPRSAESCALLVQVLGELALIEFSADRVSALGAHGVPNRSPEPIELSAAGPTVRVLDSVRTDLERSATFRDCAGRLEAIDRALAGELPAHAPAAAAAEDHLAAGAAHGAAAEPERAAAGQ